MQEVYLAQKNFKDAWDKWRNGKLKKKKRASRNIEPESVTKARDNFHQKLNFLYVSKIYPLEKKFQNDSKSSIAEVVEFLSVDIPAFRCGYEKEIFLQWLKHTELNLREVEQFQQIAVKICEANNVRREFRRWCRLMVKLADADFVFKLQNLSQSESLYIRLKSKWMLELIQKHRMDLKETTKNQ